MTNTAELPENPTELLICTKCRRGRDDPGDDRWPGQVLFDAMRRLPVPHAIRVTPVECLQNCDHGCTIALRGGARWTYVFANCDELNDPEMILDGALRYHATADGLIPWRERPEHFKRNCVARLPPLEN
ncbi:DUF1636 family protein [Marivita sp. S0852]|uniref:DUF1636 family protein n=1 Tax=Marivita sp. S0852 TaxID=3373893 RepID=UPI00398227E1